jgi:L-seryl-tRNA(Ser) seleniumtransferase
VSREDLLRALPAVHELAAAAATDAVPRWAVVEAARRVVARRRAAILAGESDSAEVAPGEVAAAATALVRPTLRRVINATGVVLHTNLGRAPLAAEARRAIDEVAAGYATLEYDLDAGARGSRHVHAAQLLRDLTGAEDAVVVNNNAAACVLALSALAAGRDVIVSRGELVEIGGSFRIPDILRTSGCRLVEVGTTNKTRIADYETACGDATALLLKVHTSNFAMVGFTEAATIDEVVALARRRGVAAMFDLGSGALQPRGDEPTVREVIAAGVDLACCSGDKLLGGPQAGILVGRAAAIARCRSHPLMRALRPDKLTLAGLAATLALHRDGRAAEVPVIAMLDATAGALAARAEALRAACGALPGLALAVEPVTSAIGGGALPLAELPSAALVVTGRAADAIERGLRTAAVPVIARVHDDKVVLDLRTIAPGDEPAVVAALRGLVV